MVNMQLTNSKLVDRGTKMVMEKTGINSYDKARELLLKFGSVKKAVDSFRA
jgi:N-acetylmuramic acid 6-phosphate etherase